MASEVGSDVCRCETNGWRVTPQAPEKKRGCARALSAAVHDAASGIATGDVAVVAGKRRLRRREVLRACLVLEALEQQLEFVFDRIEV